MPAGAGSPVAPHPQARNFDDVNRAIEAAGFGGHLRFLNYGYRPLAAEEAVGPRLGRLFPNPESAQLLFQLTHGVDVDGATVAEVGCGRGGNLWLLDRYHRPGRLVGLDITASSLDALRRSLPAATGLVADAEALPLGPASVDVALSVETSCAYGDLGAFLEEIARIVAVGGWFCWTDLLPTGVLDPALRVLVDRGFTVEHRRDITANVLASRRAVADRQRRVFERTDAPPPASLGEYVGDEGSGFARALQDGGRTYHLVQLRRTEADDPSRAGDAPVLAPDVADLVRRGALETVSLMVARPHPSDGAGPAPTPS